MNRIYLDNASTTRPYDDVIEYMSYINKEVYGNPSSLHKAGIEAERLLIKSRESVAESMKVSPKEIFFTSGGTEANNLAITGYTMANKRKGNHVITTSIEHPSIMQIFKKLEESGYDVDYIDVDCNGIVNLDMLKSKISQKTVLISVMQVNNEIGTIQPIEKIVEIKQSINQNAVVHVDAVQSYLKLETFPRKMGIDLMTISSHKVHGPKGVGALYIKNNTKINPIILGGGQEISIRSGTENTAGIGGFGMAVDTENSSFKRNLSKIEDIKQEFIKKLSRLSGVKVISPTSQASPYILSVSFQNLQAEVLLHYLEEKGIFVSSGSACSSRRNKISHVLNAIGLSPSLAKGTIRFSFSKFTTIEQIDIVATQLEQIVNKLMT